MLKRREFLRFSDPQPALNGYWLHVSRTAMACKFEVTLPSENQAGIPTAQKLLDEIATLDQQLTIFRKDSDISFINRRAAIEPVQVETSLFALLQLCQKLSDQTDGAFDITSGPLSRCWGFLRKQGKLPASDELSSAKLLVGSNQIFFDRESHTLRFARPGMEINLGSIGKGYALDCVAKKLRQKVSSALLSAGSSSFYALGNGSHSQAWSIGVRHPREKNRRLAILKLRDTALATSGNEEQFFEHEGKRYGHLIDPRSGYPTEGVSSVTVVAQSAAVADALATAFYIGGIELAEKYCARHPEVFVTMLEDGSEHPIFIGQNSHCEVER